MNLYEAIYVRKSVRSYKKEIVDSKLLEKILKFAEEIDPIFPGIGIKLEIVDNLSKYSSLKGLVNLSAPYYLVLYSEKKERNELNAGYMMEYLSLYMTTLGLGSCFIGHGKSGNKRKPGDDYEYLLTLAFGVPKGALTRNDYEARRLSLDELCAYKERPKSWVKEILETARLSPSSMNNQPWRFVVYESRVHVFSKRSAVSGSGFYKFTEINLGIMFANVMIAAEEIWADVDLIKLNNITHKNLPNNQYVLSILLKQ